MNDRDTAAEVVAAPAPGSGPEPIRPGRYRLGLDTAHVYFYRGAWIDPVDGTEWAVLHRSPLGYGGEPTAYWEHALWRLDRFVTRFTRLPDPPPQEPQDPQEAR